MVALKPEVSVSKAEEGSIQVLDKPLGFLYTRELIISDAGEAHCCHVPDGRTKKEMLCQKGDASASV